MDGLTATYSVEDGPGGCFWCRWLAFFLGARNVERVRDTGNTAYYRCRRCGHRKLVTWQGPGFGWQPIDRQWLETGEWTEIGGPPSAASGVSG